MEVAWQVWKENKVLSQHLGQEISDTWLLSFWGKQMYGGSNNRNENLL